MIARLSRISLRCLAALLGGVGIFMLWASFYAHTMIEAGMAFADLGLAAGIVLMTDGE